MTKKLLLATTNPSKAREITTALSDLALEIINLNDLTQRSAEPREDGESFEANARIKAEFWNKETGLSSLADDSGILVDALPGELGVHTVRFGAGSAASDTEWLEYFLNKMKDVPQKKRTAKFVCVIALADTNKPTEFFHGEVQGKITEKAEASLLPRIPLSSVFIPEGADKVFAAMSEIEKEQWSHRGRALQQLKEFLQKFKMA